MWKVPTRSEFYTLDDHKNCDWLSGFDNWCHIVSQNKEYKERLKQIIQPTTCGFKNDICSRMQSTIKQQAEEK